MGCVIDISTGETLEILDDNGEVPTNINNDNGSIAELPLEDRIIDGLDPERKRKEITIIISILGDQPKESNGNADTPEA